MGEGKTRRQGMRTRVWASRGQPLPKHSISFPGGAGGGETKKRRSGGQVQRESRGREAGRSRIDPVKVPALPQAMRGGEAWARSSTQPGSLPGGDPQHGSPQNCLVWLSTALQPPPMPRYDPPPSRGGQPLLPWVGARSRVGLGMGCSRFGVGA